MNRTFTSILSNYQLYLFLLPALAYFAIFQFGPMYGLQLAFKDFIAVDGIWKTDAQRIVNVINDKVAFFRAQPAYKAYLTYMNRLYREKLLDNQVISQTEDEYSAKTGQNIIGVLTDIDEADYHDFELIEPMTSEWNKTKLATPVQHFSSSSFTITRVNKYPKESIRWADIFYRDVSDPWNGFSGVSAWLGQQGVDWDYTDSTKSRIQYLFTPPANTNQTVGFTRIIGPGWGIGTVAIDAPFASDILAWVADQSKKHLFPYQNENMLFPGSIRSDKRTADRVAILSTDLKKYVEEVYPTERKDDSGAWRNAAYLIDRTGKVRGIYHGSFVAEYWAYASRAYLVGAIARHECYLVSPTGRVMAQSGWGRRHLTATVNLDRCVVHCDWDELGRLDALKRVQRPAVDIQEAGFAGNFLITNRAAEGSAEGMARRAGFRLLDELGAAEAPWQRA